MEFEDIIAELIELTDPENIAQFLYENGYNFPDMMDDTDSEIFQELVEEIINIDISNIVSEDKIIEDYRDSVRNGIELDKEDNLYKDFIDVDAILESYIYDLVIEDLGYEEIYFYDGSCRYSFYIRL